MDEAGNTAARWIPEIADTCAGIGVLLVTVWQSKAQIEQGYPTLADSVVTNPAPRSSSAACPMSRPSGTRRNSSATKRFTQTSRANDASTAANRRTVTESVIRTPLVPGYLLRRIPPGEALLVHGTLPPAHLRSRAWYDDDRLRRLAAYGTSQRTAREERHRRR